MRQTARILKAGVCALFFSASLAAASQTPFPRPDYGAYGADLYNQLKYPANFKHFDYVNPNAPKGGEAVFGIIGSFDSLNPFVIKGSPAQGMTFIHASYLYATLLAHSHDEAFASYGYIAEKIELAPDRSWVIFTLRKEAAFHDGAPITPQDVVFTFKTLKEKGNPFYRAYYRDITQAEDLGSGQVKFSFASGKNLELPLIIGEMPILSKTYYEKHKFESATLAIPLGSGPYKIETVDAGKSIAYKRVQKWWGENLPVNKGQYNFDRIKFLYFRDGTIAFEAFKTGAYDIRIENEAKNWAKGYEIAAVKDGKLIKKSVAHEMIQPMQGLVFNTRRDLFKDKAVREALGLLFDFEWVNKNLFYGFYKRTKSFFENSELCSRGLPTGEELKLLEPFRAQLQPEVFNVPFKPPVTDGSGVIRPQIKKAQDLLESAGWAIRDQTLVNAKTGQPFAFEIVIQTPIYARLLQGFVNNLKRVGVTATLRVVDPAQYEARVNDFDFDMIFQVIAQSPSPGNEQIEFWSSKTADIKGSRNYAGVKNPIVDQLIGRVLNAASREDLIASTRALDRVLLWDHIVIPLYHNNQYWIAYWDKFGQPSIVPSYNLPFDTWWAKAKDERAK